VHVLNIDAGEAEVGGREFLLDAQEVDTGRPGGCESESLADNLGPVAGFEEVVESDGALDIG
jgi:hypothetical protein